MSPLFSVIIPLYNKENYIENTIKSVLAQSFSDFEVVIVNDGSTDNSEAIVNYFNDSRIRFFTIENHGVSYARNFAIKKAEGKLIAFLDADDIWYTHHLEDLKKLYDYYPNCGLYCKAYLKKNRNATIKPHFKKIPKQLNWMGIVEDYFESSLINCIAWTSAVAIPKKKINSIGFFDTAITLGAGEDTDLWLRIALKYPVAFYNKISAIHNLHAENRLSKLNTNNRKFLNLDKYNILSEGNKSLKVYLDINRFSIAIQYKLVGNTVKANEYIEKIHKTNLNKKQRFLLSFNTPFLKLFFNVKNYLCKHNIPFSIYK